MDFLVTFRSRLPATFVETAEFVVFEGKKCSSRCSAQVSCKPQGYAQTSNLNPWKEEKRMRLEMKVLAVFVLAVMLPCLTVAQYTRTDLVTNSGAGGTVPDPNLVNGWGLVSTSTSPFWVSDNGTGVSTLYSINNTNGVAATRVGLVVSIPSVSGGPGTPTGIVAPETPAGVQAFTITGTNPITGKQVSANSLFIFATLDGTISGWNPAVGGVSATGASTATLAANRSSAGATYTGLAIATNNGQKFLYAADDGENRRIDVFDSSFQLVDSENAFVDTKIPKKFAPYGIQTITDADGIETIWVTYTALDKSQGGFVDSFTPAGVLKTHFAVSGPLHSPWGVALAPADFGPMSNALLVTNNTPHGRINAFDPKTGAFLGPLRDANGKAIEIDDVWAIQFGQGGLAGANGNPNQLFFTAGNNNYGDGTFGVITFGQ
jgi:uncharacterized protein (TIGR03118 family)